jgi:hypothetical protein
LFSLVVTWPLVGWIDTSLPNGTEVPGTVAFFNLWTMRWNQQQFGDLFRHYWDAPIFHPEPGAFALSEPQPLTGLVFTPLSWLTGQPGIAYNLIVLAAITLNGLAIARLCRRLGVAPGPALLVGLIGQALPFVTNELGVLQLVMVFPLVFLADAILAWAEEATWPRGLAMGVWLSVTFLTCGYYGLFAVVVIGPAALVLARRDWLGARRVLQLGAAAALFAVLCGPILLGQNHYTSNYHRSDETITANSAQPHNWVTLLDRLPGSKIEPWLSEEGGERLYPGTVVLGLALAGAWVIAGGPVAGRSRTAALGFLGVGIALAFLLSLGLRLSVFGWQPYQLVRERVPGFGDLRSPFRAGVLVQLFLLPLAGVALDRVWRAFTGSPGEGAAVAVAPAAVGAVGEIEDGIEDEIEDEDELEAGAGGRARQPVVAAAGVGGVGIGGLAGAEGPPPPVDGAAGDGVGGLAAEPDGGADIDPVTGSGAGLDADPYAGPHAGEASEPDPDLDPAAVVVAPGPTVRLLPEWADPWVDRARPWLGRVLAVGIAVLAFAELYPLSQPLVDVPTVGTGTDWVDFLAAQHDPGAGDGSVAMVPFPASGNYASYEATTKWMLAALDHGHPLVNGYSGLYPESYDTLEGAMREGFPSDRSVALLTEDHVSWVVAPPAGSGTEEQAAYDSWSDVLRPVFQGEDMVVYSFTPPAPLAPSS